MVAAVPSTPLQFTRIQEMCEKEPHHLANDFHGVAPLAMKCISLFQDL